MGKEFRVWWIPQIPGDPFYVKVSSPEEAGKLIQILADYDQFQFDNDIKPDYSNTGGLEVFEDSEWSEWYDEETGMDIDEFIESKNIDLNFLIK